MERVLQLIHKRLSSFDPQLVIDQHKNFFREEYYKAAFLGQEVPLYSVNEDKMVPEDLTTDFISYIAIVLQINDRALEEHELQAFDD